MGQSFFTISFPYDILPESLQVQLCAEIEMITDEICIVRNIRRVHLNESPLLPELQLTRTNGRWMHSDGVRESHISKVIGEAIARHQMQIVKDPGQKKDSA